MGIAMRKACKRLRLVGPLIQYLRLSLTASACANRKCMPFELGFPPVLQRMCDNRLRLAWGLHARVRKGHEINMRVFGAHLPVGL